MAEREEYEPSVWETRDFDGYKGGPVTEMVRLARNDGNIKVVSTFW